MTSIRFWNQLHELALPLGNVQGVPLRLHVSFLLVFPLAFFLSGGDLAWSCKLTIAVFVLVLIHECGHLCAARLAGGYCDQLVMWPFGGLVYADTALRPIPQFFVALAGPLTHLAIAALFLPWTIENFPPALWPSPAHTRDRDLFLTVNQLLFLANVVPSFVTDGGRIWQGLLWRFVGFRKATLVTALASVAAGSAAVVYGAACGQAMFVAAGAFLVGSTLWHLWRFRVAEVVDGVWVETPALFSAGYRAKRLFVGARDWYGKRCQEREHLRRSREAMELDALLHKITVVGLAGLTSRERRFLQRQSDRLQRKRGISLR